jgi:hypothetical protein
MEVTKMSKYKDGWGCLEVNIRGKLLKVRGVRMRHKGSVWRRKSESKFKGGWGGLETRNKVEFPCSRIVGLVYLEVI